MLREINFIMQFLTNQSDLNNKTKSQNLHIKAEKLKLHLISLLHNEKNIIPD